MANNEVTFRVHVVDDATGSIKKISVESDNLAEAMESANNSTKKFDDELINLNQRLQVFDTLHGALSELNAVFKGLSAAYEAQETAESKLEQVMRNTMNATDAEIESVKRLASEQQKLGVIGDEVQLAAAQELATYLELSSSLESLLPTLNDMTAQQYGVNASQESATQIATMLGKVMEGQTSALSRYGYSFSEAEEEILKFGTEEERAAILAEVVGRSVSGVNAALAQTSSGKMAQLNNVIGDIKESIGGAVSGAAKFVQATTSIAAGINTFVKLSGTISNLQKSMSMAQLAAAGLRTAMLGIAGIALGAVVALVKNLSDATRESAEQAERLQQTYNDAYTTASSGITESRVRLKSLISTQGDEHDIVAQMNAQYGETFGNYSTAAEWYDVLTSKSVAYAKAKAQEARLSAMASEQVNLQSALEDKQSRLSNMSSTSFAWGKNTVAGLNKGIEQDKQRIAELDAEMNALAASITAAYAEIRQPAMETVVATEQIVDNTKQAVVEAEQLATAYQEVSRKTFDGNVSMVGGLVTPKLTGDVGLQPMREMSSIAIAGTPALEAYAEAIDGIGSAMGSIADVVDESAAAWLEWGSNLLQAIASAIPQIVALTAAGKAENSVAMTGAVAKSANAVASIPIVGPALAIAAVASMVATMLSIPKFAAGGVAYGPTLGLFGEYAGASSNPEVVAPLDRLRTILNMPGMGAGKVEFVIEGRRLKGVLDKVERTDSRS